MINHEEIMNGCIELAVKGLGCVSPNPVVGCIIIKDGRIIAKGFHRKFGGPHAEVIAINEAKKRISSLRGASLYVNLEPCSHYGKTPPCTDLIVKEGFKNIYIGTKDLNPIVNGKGIRELKKAGLNVYSGILEETCKEINKSFFFSHKNKRPYVTLKFAQSIDGFIAINNLRSKWITNIYTRKIAHNIRAFNDAILIGANTLRTDNPVLDCRLTDKKINPAVVVLSGKSRIDYNSRIFSKHGRKAYIFTLNEKNAGNIPENVKVKVLKQLESPFRLKSVLHDLYKEGINSLLVEGGSFTLSQFYKHNMFEEMYVMIAPKIFGNGINTFKDYLTRSVSGRKDLVVNDFFSSGNDIIINYKNYK